MVIPDGLSLTKDIRGIDQAELFIGPGVVEVGG